MTNRDLQNVDKRFDPYIEGILSQCMTWYAYDQPTVDVPPGLEEANTSLQFLSTKQVASSTFLRKAPNSTVKAKLRHLYYSGFPLTVQKDGQGPYVPVPPRGRPTLSVSSRSSLRTLLTEASSSQPTGSPTASRRESLRDEPIISDPLSHIEEDVRPLPDVLHLGPKDRVKIDYADPWKIHAIQSWYARVGKTPPVVHVWNGDTFRLSDKLPLSVLNHHRGEISGNFTNQIRFSDVIDADLRVSILFKHTHWGKHLVRMRYDSSCKSQEWAKTLWGRIKNFLHGDPDPLWSKRTRSTFAQAKRPSASARSKRLIEVLKTIDGMFTGRFLACPEEVWTWQKYDTFVLWNLSYLLSDEFYDGVIPNQGMDIVSSYSQLKTVRKTLKYLGHTQATSDAVLAAEMDCPRWLRSMYKIYRLVYKRSGYQYLADINYLTQTRACGTPPPLVLLQSKYKFIRTVGTKPVPLSKETKRLVKAAVSEVIADIEPSNFTGLATKARITVNTSASWENTRKEGGTTQAIQDILADTVFGVRAKIIDLDTGQLDKYSSLEELGPGTYIFWRALEVVMSLTPEELRIAYLTVVTEPGKGRSITKGRACLKVVLDLVSRICATPLAKGLRSSVSGMSMTNQGWNLFRNLHSQILEKLVYHVDKTEVEEFGGYVKQTDHYRDLFASSTDFEEATDSMHHEVASILGPLWMRQCGIPKVLQGIVIATCYRPRTIVFTAHGALKTIGEPYGEDLRAITLWQGVLMGDPLTKVVLHLLNASVRKLAQKATNVDFLRKVYDNPFWASDTIGSLPGNPSSVP